MIANNDSTQYYGELYDLISKLKQNQDWFPVGFPSESNSFAGAGKAFHAVTLEDFNRLISQGVVQFGREVKPLNILLVVMYWKESANWIALCPDLEVAPCLLDHMV
jgi:hypothetical protein